jgi:polyphenol oxidase
MTLEILTSDSLSPTRHGFFTRRGGASSGVFTGLNCGTGSSDQSEIVGINRGRVADAMGVAPDHLVGVHQVHSATVVRVTGPLDPKPRADAMVTDQPGIALSVLTADCQPVLFADAEAGVIGAAHAGWRGALDGILENTVEAMVELGAQRERIAAVIGPSISQRAYEVGPELLRSGHG